MLQQGHAKKVTIYVGEAVKHRHEPVFIAVLNYLFYHNVANATLTRGAGGFGADHRMEMARLVESSFNLPVKIEFIEERAKAEEILPKLLEIVEEGLVEIHDTTILKPGGAGTAPVTRAVLKGKATLMRIYIGEHDKWRGKPLYDAIVESLRAHDIAGATVYRGIAGYGAQGRFLPILLSVVDDDVKIRAYLPVLEQLVEDGLVVLSDADVIKYTHRLDTPLSTEAQS
ncbi:MAG TPA: DUF190 domain-containing protein [Vicinamibacterales bacterium]|nr:DUF190 domain-containing protein [Vicinamibacterales bacterium]